MTQDALSASKIVYVTRLDGLLKGISDNVNQMLRSSLRPLPAPKHSLRVDVPKLLVPRSFKHSYEPFKELTDRLAPFVEQIRAKLPDNWPTSLLQLEEIRSIIESEGIPMVYVPRPEIVGALVAASTYEERRDILQARSEDIAKDCLAAVEAGIDAEYSDQLPLAVDAAESLAQGHFRSAHALAVVVSDTIVRRMVDENYVKATRQTKIKDLDSDFRAGLFRVSLAAAVIERFHTDWHPNSPHPMPVEVSRHVSIHHASVEHYNEPNAVIAVMICASLLRAFTELRSLAEQ